MVTGIIGAMEIEVAALKESMTDCHVTKKARMGFNRGKLCGRDVVVVRSGVGKVNAGICAQILCDDFGAGAIINTGVAGSLKPEINIGDIVLSKETLQHDMDATGFGYPEGEIPQMDRSVFEGDKHLIELARDVCAKELAQINVFEGRIVSGDQFISSDGKKEHIISRFGGLCTEMEGAAIAQAAYLNGVPFLVIRAISDKADNSAQMDYPEFEKMAAANSVKLIKGLLTRM